jgi:hypothetical protein
MKARAASRILSMQGEQFYVTLVAAHRANRLRDFAAYIGANEPVLEMSTDLSGWNLAHSQPNAWRIHRYNGPPTLELLGSYFRHAHHRPATALMKAGVRYIELGLPDVCTSLSQSEVCN